MCGIAGYFFPNVECKYSKELKEMALLQEHRGPDYTGFYYAKEAGFAHNRLSLLDLSENGNQPFYNDRYVLVFNGEIYNFKELDSKLSSYSKKSTSDTEVLFQCLLQWGVEKTLSEIEGMFAFAFYDTLEKELYLCRDRFGIKPMFIGYLKGGGYCFSSELKSISQVWDCEKDEIQMMYSMLGVLEKSNQRTAWKNISVVPTGSFIRINAEGATISNYYTITDVVDETEYKRREKASWKDVLEEFNVVFKNSVSKMLVADAPMGAYVSGGIDSSLISCYAEKENIENFKLFTANILGPYSEFEDAKQLSKALSMPLFDYKYEKETVFKDWAKATWHYDAPITTHISALPFSKVSYLAHEHKVKAVLTGEGSDELFLGYPRLLTRRYDNLIKGPFQFLNWVYKKHTKLANYIDSNRGSGGLLHVFEKTAQGFTRQINEQDQIGCYHFVSPKFQKDQYMSAQMMQEGIRSLLWRNDRMGMIYSIESRFPYLDESVVKFAMNLPVKFKIGRTNTFYNYKHPFLMDKAIVRKMAADKLPKSLVNKKKNGFPLHGLREMKVQSRFLHQSCFADLFKLNNKEVDYLVSSQNNYHVALIASFDIWARLFIKRQSIEEVTKDIQQHISF